jgi:hypothetical protein
VNPDSPHLAAEYYALLDGEVTPQKKAQIMGGDLLRLLAVRP